MKFEIKDTILFTLAPQENEKLKYKSNKIYTKPMSRKLQSSEERDEITDEGYSMLMVRKAQYCKHVSSSQFDP